MKSGNTSISRGKASGHGRRSAESSGLTFEPAIGEGIRKLGSTYSTYDNFTLTYSSHRHCAGPSHAETVESSTAWQSPVTGAGPSRGARRDTQSQSSHRCRRAAYHRAARPSSIVQAPVWGSNAMKQSTRVRSPVVVRRRLTARPSELEHSSRTRLIVVRGRLTARPSSRAE